MVELVEASALAATVAEIADVETEVEAVAVVDVEATRVRRRNGSQSPSSAVL